MSLAGAQLFDLSVSAGVVHHGIDLLQYGVAWDRSARAASVEHPHIFVQHEGVMVSGEYVHSSDKQHKPTRSVWEDRSQEDPTIILEQLYRYAELVDGRIALQEIQQTDVADQIDQQLLRAFNTSGLIEGEMLLINGAVHTQRWYQYNGEGCLVLEEHYRENGQLADRQTCTKLPTQTTWTVSGSTTQNGYESLYVKQPLLTLLPLSGLPARQAFAPAFMLPIESERMFPSVQSLKE